MDPLKATVLLVGKFLPAVMDRPVIHRPVMDRPEDLHQVMANPASILRSPATARHIQARNHSNPPRRAARVA